MSDFRFFSTHRPWEDWFGMLLGVLIMVSPWFPMQASHDVVDAERSYLILNTFVVGMLVLGLAQLEYVALQRWEEVAEVALGLWLIASPNIFGYSEDRKTERRLLADYETLLGEVLAKLTPANHPLAVGLSAIPEKIRGFGPVKARHLTAAKTDQEALLEQFRSGKPTLLKAAE